MESKAKLSWDEAHTLASAGHYNGAASRLYYSLYQAVVAEFESRGIRQDQLSAKHDPNRPERWLHEVIRNNATLAGITRRDSMVLTYAWTLRVKADYRTLNVDRREFEALLKNARNLLLELGVSV